jgi:hypothetical protein
MPDKKTLWVSAVVLIIVILVGVYAFTDQSSEGGLIEEQETIDELDRILQSEDIFSEEPLLTQ